ncbi:MAG: sensor histidine kinase [Micrococcales bacterium]
MLQWIQARAWLPEIIFTATAIGVFSLIDLLNQGPEAAAISALFGVSAFFFRKWSFLAPIPIAVASILEVVLNQGILVGGVATTLTIFLLSVFAKRNFSLLATAAIMAGGILVAWNAAFNRTLAPGVYGVAIFNEAGRLNAFLALSLAVVGFNSFAWILGGFFSELREQRQVSKEKELVKAAQLRTALDIAEQNQRFAIARDLNDLTLQRISAMLTLADGARYASKLDPDVAGRTIDRLLELIRDSRDEMRRLHDMLTKSVSVAVAPPGISDLNVLAAQYRELGYNVKLQHLGERQILIPSAELNIYRIVYDALENVLQHAPVGTDVDISFTWSDQGLQVLVKDNGVEHANRVQSLTEDSYTSAQDLEALTQEVTGPGITGMRERAQLFQGSIEAKRVPGVGFTLNAIFPGIAEFAGRQGS